MRTIKRQDPRALAAPAERLPYLGVPEEMRRWEEARAFRRALNRGLTLARSGRGADSPSSRLIARENARETPRPRRAARP